jgi:hypothetical protein
MRSMLLLALLLVAGCKNPVAPDLSGLDLSSPDVGRHAQELGGVATASTADTLSVSTVEGD